MSIEAARAAITQGAMDKAENILRALLTQNSNDGAALFLLADIMAARGQIQEAKALIEPLAAASPTPETLQFLALLQYELQEFVACEATLDRCVRTSPSQLPSKMYFQLAKLKYNAGKIEEARAVLATAIPIYPTATGLVSWRSALLADKAQACAELEAYLTANQPGPSAAAPILKELTIMRARLKRRESAAPPSFGTSWDDTCHWPDPEGLARFKRSLLLEISAPTCRATAVEDLACIAVAAQNWKRADELLNHFRKSTRANTNSFADYTALGDDFHAHLDQLNDDAIFSALPEVTYLAAEPYHTEAALFLASDAKYFKHFTLPFIRALEESSAPVDVHVHVFDCGAQEVAGISASLRGFTNVHISLSVENAEAHKRGLPYARTYYHAVRFVRFYGELKRTRRRMIIMDVDVHLLRDPSALIERLAAHDLAIQSTPFCFDPAHKIRACFVGVSPTPKGLAFARRTAAYISHWKDCEKWGWGIDQAALFSSYAHMYSRGEAPNTLFLDESAICMSNVTTGVFQFPSSMAKWTDSAPPASA